MAVTMMSKRLASGMAEGGSAPMPPRPHCRFHCPPKTTSKDRGRCRVNLVTSPVKSILRSALGSDTARLPAAQLSSARIGSARPCMLLSSMHALTHRSKTAFPARSWLHAESLELPLATTDALTRHVAPRQVGRDTSLQQTSPHRLVLPHACHQPLLWFFSVGRAVPGRGQRARLAWMQSGCSVTKRK
jgi:hypothetical protein